MANSMFLKTKRVDFDVKNPLISIKYDDAQEAEAVNEPVVYSQSPASGEQLLEGSMVNLKLSTNVEKALTTQGQESEEDFF